LELWLPYDCRETVINSLYASLEMYNKSKHTRVIVEKGTAMSKDKKRNKDSQLIIRLNKDDKEDFLALCDELDTSAAREVRRFIREFVGATQQRQGVGS